MENNKKTYHCILPVRGLFGGFLADSFLLGSALWFIPPSEETQFLPFSNLWSCHGRAASTFLPGIKQTSLRESSKGMP